MRVSFVFIFVRLKPLAIIVALETLEEVEEFGSKVVRHGELRLRGSGRESKAITRVLRTDFDREESQRKGVWFGYVRCRFHE